MVVLTGLPAVRFDFFSILCNLIGAKKYPVGFPTRLVMLADRQNAYFYTHLPFSRIIRKKEVQLILTLVN